ncbi:MAG: pyrroloquinoline-quinone synthase PqqC [Candidatus Competibacterales bacterium]|nr:pyrroloquinoline-quinone synthase PqqC [Candidatus Competibacterales bacterium]
MSDDTAAAWTAEAFEARLRSLGDHYHIHHPFQVAMHEGRLTREQIQGWVANRFYYQIRIPNKDGAILASCPDREVRRRWIQRIIDHDGREGTEGGIEAWIRLGEAVGLSREALIGQQHVLPGVRFAVDAYVNYARQAPWQEAVCSSLTELFAPTIHRQRLSDWPRHYAWIDPEGLQYFRNRLNEAHRDVQHGLEIVLAHFRSREQQERALGILRFKLEVLWTMLDAMYMAYVVGKPPFFNVGRPA